MKQRIMININAVELNEVQNIFRASLKLNKLPVKGIMLFFTKCTSELHFNAVFRLRGIIQNDAFEHNVISLILFYEGYLSRLMSMRKWTLSNSKFL
jgi:hypothetical protein